MSRFGSDPLAFFNSVYKDVPPWDIGTHQPAMAALLAKYPPVNPVLDVGCGSGDLAIYLAQLGHHVVGIDFVESAIKTAQSKIGSLAPETAQLLNFQVADALKPSLLQKKFRAVVDSGFYHLFNSQQCDQLIDEIALTLLPNGHYYLHEFAIEFPVPNMPRQITADELQARFTADKGWRIREIQSVEFLSRVAPPVPAICACIERLLTLTAPLRLECLCGPITCCNEQKLSCAGGAGMCSTHGYKVQFPQPAGTCLSRSPHVPETTIRRTS